MYRKRIILTLAVFVLITAALTTFTGCKDDDSSQTQIADTTTDNQFVNSRCPIMNTTIDPEKVTDDLIREHRDQKVAFCCSGCPEKWDKLTDEEKDQKLKDAK